MKLQSTHWQASAAGKPSAGMPGYGMHHGSPSPPSVRTFQPSTHSLHPLAALQSVDTVRFGASSRRSRVQPKPPEKQEPEKRSLFNRFMWSSVVAGIAGTVGFMIGLSSLIWALPLSMYIIPAAGLGSALIGGGLTFYLLSRDPKKPNAQNQTDEAGEGTSAGAAPTAEKSGTGGGSFLTDPDPVDPAGETRNAGGEETPKVESPDAPKTSLKALSETRGNHTIQRWVKDYGVKLYQLQQTYCSTMSTDEGDKPSVNEDYQGALRDLATANELKTSLIQALNDAGIKEETHVNAIDAVRDLNISIREAKNDVQRDTQIIQDSTHELLAFIHTHGVADAAIPEMAEYKRLIADLNSIYANFNLGHVNGVLGKKPKDLKADINHLIEQINKQETEPTQKLALSLQVLAKSVHMAALMDGVVDYRSIAKRSTEVAERFKQKRPGLDRLIKAYGHQVNESSSTQAMAWVYQQLLPYVAALSKHLAEPESTTSEFTDPLSEYSEKQQIKTAKWILGHNASFITAFKPTEKEHWLYDLDSRYKDKQQSSSFAKQYFSYVLGQNTAIEDKLNTFLLKDIEETDDD